MRVKSFIVGLVLLGVCAGCVEDAQKSKTNAMRPRTMYDVPSARLAYRLEPDVPFDAPAPPTEKLDAIQKDFDVNRKQDALIRTVVAPDNLRAAVEKVTG